MSYTDFEDDIGYQIRFPRETDFEDDDFEDDFEDDIEYQIQFLCETFSLDRANIAEGFNCASGFLFGQKQQLLEAVVGDTVGVTDSEGGTARPMVEGLLAIYHDYAQPIDLRPLVAISLMVEALLTRIMHQA